MGRRSERVVASRRRAACRTGAPRPAGTTVRAVGGRVEPRSSIGARHRSGSRRRPARSVNDTGMPVASATPAIQSSSISGGSRSSPRRAHAARPRTRRGRRRRRSRCPSPNSSSSRREGAGHRLAVERRVRRACATVENPSAPASIASRTMRGHRPRCRRRSPASLRAPRSPITYARSGAVRRPARRRRSRTRRRVERVEVLGEASPSSQWMPSCSAVPGMSSTPSISSIEPVVAAGRARARSRRRSCRSTTVVTPCQADGVEHRVPRGLAVVVRVHVDEARRDEQPGRVDDLAAAPPSTVPPTATMTPSLTATSPREPGRPVPSTSGRS